MTGHGYGTTVMATAIAAIVVGVAVAGLGGWVTVRATTAAGDTLDLTVEALGAADDGVAVAADAIEGVRGVLAEAQRSVFAAGIALGEAAPLVDEVADTLGTDVADAVDSAVDTLPALVEVGGVVDATLGALGFITGNPYDPEVPLDEALAGLETALAPIPEQLRTQASALAEANATTSNLADGLRSTAEELSTLGRSLEEAAILLDEYGETTADALALADDLGRDIDRLRVPAVVAVVGVGLLLAASQLVPVLVGLGLRGTGPLAQLGDEDADQAEPGGDGVGDDEAVTEVQPERFGGQADRGGGEDPG